MELNLEGVVVGAASLLVIGAFHPLVIWCEYRFTQRIWPVFLIAGLLCLLAALLIQAGLAGVPDRRPALPADGPFDPGDLVHPFGAAGRRLPVEHPGAEGAGQAGGARVVSQKSQKKITDCRRNVFLPCGSLFLDSRGAVLYNYPMVSNN